MNAGNCTLVGGGEAVFVFDRETGEPVWPTFRDGCEVNRVVAAALRSNHERGWVKVADL